jgi:glutamate 5-kinase
VGAKRPDAPRSLDPAARRAELARARTVIIKVGSALLAAPAPQEAGPLERDPFAALAAQCMALRKQGIRVVVVSSGAIALGLSALGLSERPRDLAGLQAAAAAGQSKLMARWAEAFGRHGAEVAQILLTHGDLRDRRRYLNARQALVRLLDAGVIPIVNENDTVAVDEIKLGDNDTLAAQICGLCDARAIVLLTNAAGLFSADPSADPAAVRIPIVEALEEVRAFAGPAARLGTGGMTTKLDAAAVAQRHGAATVIAPGRAPQVLEKIFAGEDIGTLVVAPEEDRERARKRWIGTTLRPRGTVFVDDGAARALAKNASLLFAGVVSVEGTFQAGDAVNVARARDGAVFGRGLTRLSSIDAQAVMGKKSAEAHALLPALPDELIHRDDLVLF